MFSNCQPVRGVLRPLFLLLFLFLFSSQAFPFSFIVFGDNQGNEQKLNALISKINKEKDVAFIVNLGDFTARGLPNEYEHYKKRAAEFKVPVYNVIGNHDALLGGWRTFNKVFGPLYYSFDYQGSHFTVLDNSFRQSFDKEQFAWFKKDLANASQAKHRFVFMHRPTFDPSEIYKDHVMSGREVVNELMAQVKKNKVDYVFAGHIHGYAKAERDGVFYIVCAGGGAPLYLPPEFGGVYHYLKVTVEDGKVSDKVVKIDE